MAGTINFEGKTIDIAEELIGKCIRYQSNKGIVSGIINETEAYTQEDPACHAFNGKKTKRNSPMFLKGGHIYIYFIYGMHHCLNIVTEEENRGCAVLIRSIVPLEGKKVIEENRGTKNTLKSCNGPSKLMMGLGIPATLNTQFIYDTNCPLSIHDIGINATIKKGHRIGIKKGQDLAWRFFDNSLFNLDLTQY